jgi:cell division protease FtsH
MSASPSMFNNPDGAPHRARRRPPMSPNHASISMTNLPNTLNVDHSTMNSVSVSFTDVPRGDMPSGERDRAKAMPPVGHCFATVSGDDKIEKREMGPLERREYMKAYRLALTQKARERLRDEKVRVEERREKAREAAIDAAVAALHAAGQKVDREDIADQIVLPEEPPASSNRASRGADDETRGRNSKKSPPEPPGAGRLAVKLLLARLADREPSVRSAFLGHDAPVVLMDVPDSTALERVFYNWKDVWLFDDSVVVNAKKSDIEKIDRWTTTAIMFLASGRRKSGKDSAEDYLRVVTAANKRIPIIGISEDARSCLPECMNAIATHRVTFYALDAETVRLVIRAITGRPCRTLIEPQVVKKITFDDLPLAIRPGRSPHECMEKLRDLVKRRERTKDARDLSLDELHGLDEAVAWARASIRDLQSFKTGEIGWADIDNGVVLDGPPGTGKTTFAKVFAHEAGLPLITGTLAQWQGSGPGHLGSLLKAMRECFDEARRQAPAVVFIDEVDAFADRSKVTHDHKDYVIEVTNAFLEQLDGLAGREGLIFIAASNDVRRCDPAILRAGRLNRIIQIPLPNAGDLAKMFRVRLRDDLMGVDLDEAALMASGFTGADVERAVKDARRLARQGDRLMVVDDLLHSIIGDDGDRSHDLLRRTAIHEAGHAFVCGEHFGADRVTVTIRARLNTGGRTIVAKLPTDELHTRDDMIAEIKRLLAGRAAEEIILGDAGAGAGGSADSDLGKATALAAAMAGSLGLIGPTPLLYRGGVVGIEVLDLHPAMQKVAHEFLSAVYADTLIIIRANRKKVEAIASSLLARKTLSGVELGKIMSAPQSEESATPDLQLNINDGDAPMCDERRDEPERPDARPFDLKDCS